MATDQSTADAFASSWNNLPVGTVYSREQAEEWFSPLTPQDVAGRRVLELGCGNGSLMVHMMAWHPAFIEGVDLGASVRSATDNMSQFPRSSWAITRADLTEYSAHNAFDVVYSVGVIHHLESPKRGFEAVLRNVSPGGLFHCWVYAHEGNGVIRWLVEPVRKVSCRLPWWVTKYLIATPLVVPYYLYAKFIRAFLKHPRFGFLPLHSYSLWIAARGFAFFRHVAFDQLVTPRTTYIQRSTVDEWLKTHPEVEPGTTYAIFRNGNSWKFGGRKRASDQISSPS